MVGRVGHLLETVSLAQSPAVTDDGLLCLAAAPRLRSLTLRQLPRVTGASFPALAAGCSALETLDMQVSRALGAEPRFTGADTHGVMYRLRDAHQKHASSSSTYTDDVSGNTSGHGFSAAEADTQLHYSCKCDHVYVTELTDIDPDFPCHRAFALQHPPQHQCSERTLSASVSTHCRSFRPGTGAWPCGAASSCRSSQC